ncbi:carboxypeptidase regulatory-like domain-containing protein [Marinobacter sp. CHS3-4]|uniref:carboxypeptidase regulatory-like domain-containing protein n=1 Tax=Marinobacter sp. CHS3-4 TaxID=3045174 RepID=UPI0024B4F488|nr:carboxypeptidase regulatory-like domain-containing protein [Marinobacter sp. CHS3-4]MDI9243894.1 carboxypeptidase regulatory-like domain-containing protein [Marinobacter sp. CHS3-4]
MNYLNIFRITLLLISSFFLTACLSSGGSSQSSTNETANPTTTELNGLVRNYFTGEPINSASVTISSADGGQLAEGQTNAEGEFQLAANSGLSRVSVNASAQGFGDMSRVASTIDGSASGRIELSLLPSDLEQIIDPSVANTLSVNGLGIVDLAANTFVLDNGATYSGNVNAEVTVIDPTSDPDVMPGGYQAVSAEGGEGLMESWGAITATFEGANGETLQLRQGDTATIRIPLAQGRSAANSPASIPLFFFDQDTGIWREEGSATLRMESGETFYQGQVSHFTTWNADVLYESVNVTGRVVDASGEPVADANVTAEGQSYIGSSSSTTGADGRFTLEVRPDSDFLIVASRATRSNTRSVTIGDTDLELQDDIVLSEAAVAITLSWGENPSDLDSHLFGPSDENQSTEFHVYYSNSSEIVGGTVIDLDVDDTSSFGPEVITVPQFPYAGTYRYLVHLYSGSGSILDSPARVEVSIDGVTRIFSPSQAQGQVSEWWAVANFVVDGNGDVSLQTVQEWRTSSDNQIQAQVSPAVFGDSTTSKTPHQGQIDRKYYSR